jgi:hypothetical protein
MRRQEEMAPEVLEQIEKLKAEYGRIPELIWKDLWEKFGGISFGSGNDETNFKEGQRQVLYYLLTMAGKLHNFTQMEALWRAKAKEPRRRQ